MTVAVSQLAKEFGLDRSNTRRYLIKNGFEFVRIREGSAGNQKVIALSDEDADRARCLRKEQGFGSRDPAVAFSEATGVLYLIQTVPDLDPHRVKIGFTTNIDARFAAHRTTSPTANILASWRCRRDWESAAIASLTRADCKLLGYEVVIAQNIQDLIDRGNVFFSTLPDP